MSSLPRIAVRCLYTALLCLVAPLISGCGSLSSSASVDQGEVEMPGGTLTGQLHGGNQPIAAATVNLYSVGTSGYGSAGTLLATTTTSIDGNGYFSFTQNAGGTPGPTFPVTATYTCPTATTQIYLEAHGGATQGVGNGTNSAAAFAVAIGQCGSAAPLFINLNEVTSTATMAALQQYFNPVSETFGYANTTTQSALGFANNVALIQNLVTLSSGSANTSITQTATPLGYGTLTGTPVSVTVTPEYKKINLIANILASCVNTTSNTSSGCSNLFTWAVPPTAAFTSQPTQTFTSITASNEDTLQALYFMLTNPTSGGAVSGNTTSSGTNITNLFGLATGIGSLFQPVYATAPTDWTVGINYASSNTCVTQVGSTTTTSTGNFLSGMTNLAVDASGNIWGASNNSSSSANLYELSPLGVPLSCGLGTTGGASNSTVIDSAGYVWTDTTTETGSNYALYKWNPTAGALDSTWPAFTYASSNGPITRALTADGSGNIFLAAGSDESPDTSYAGYVGEFAGAGVAGASPTGGSAITLTTISSTIYDSPDAIQVDSSGNLWIPIASLGSSPTPTQYFSEVYPSSGSYATTNNSYSAASGTIQNPVGVAVGQNSSATEMVMTENSSGFSGRSYNLIYFSPGSTNGTITTPTKENEYIAGTYTPGGLAVDGASNVWGPVAHIFGGNWVTGGTCSSGCPYGLFEMSVTGVNISATDSANGDSGGFQKDPTLILPKQPSGIAVDPSGNVWVGETGGTSIMELVGQGVPVATPLSTATANGLLGAKP